MDDTTSANRYAEPLSNRIAEAEYAERASAGSPRYADLMKTPTPYANIPAGYSEPCVTADRIDFSPDSLRGSLNRLEHAIHNTGHMVGEVGAHFAPVSIRLPEFPNKDTQPEPAPACSETVNQINYLTKRVEDLHEQLAKIIGTARI